MQLAQEVAFQPLSQLAWRDYHAQSGEIDESAIARRKVLYADRLEVELPLQKAQDVVDESEGEDDRQILPFELPEAIEDGAEVSVSTEADEDERAKDEGDEQAAS
jgi:hypothetical protein